MGDGEGDLLADDRMARLQTTTAVANVPMMHPTPSVANKSHAPTMATWYNPNQLELAARVCGGFVVPAVCMFGIACNALNLLVLTRRQMRGSPYTYLLGLAVTDVTVLTLSFVESALFKRFGEGVFLWEVGRSTVLLSTRCF
jgi:hypothetical protein